MAHLKSFIILLILCVVSCQHEIVHFTLRDLHLDDVIDRSQLLDTKFLVKRATDAITFRDDDMEETTYQFSFKTDDQERSEKGLINKNGETSVVGAYMINYPNGLRQTTMYVADKNGYHPQVQLRFSNALKSLVGK